MVGTSKILTVSYGTFSCTLEGFDDSFSTMKAIAEYFRGLASEDRYFGAEPPTPDAEMLAKIAEREISRRVDARTEGQGIVLRATALDSQPAPDQPTITEPVDTKSAENEAARKAERDSIKAELKARKAADQAAAKEKAADEKRAEQAAKDASDIEHASDKSALATEETTSQPAVAPATDIAPPSKSIEQTRDTTKAPDGSEVTNNSAPPDPDSVAAKLQRIRAVVGTAPQTDTAEGASNTATPDTDVPLATAQTEAATAEPPPHDAEKADAEPSAPRATAADIPTPAPQEAPATPPKVRIVRMKRSEYEKSKQAETTEGPDFGLLDGADELDDYLEDSDFTDSDPVDLAFTALPDELDTIEDDTPATPDVANTAADKQPASKTALLKEDRPLDDNNVNRLLSETDVQFKDPKGSRRRDAIAQLKAAVAAKEAARKIGERDDDGKAAENPFRNDLSAAVNNARTRPAPLKLVPAQRVDLTEADKRNGPVVPRRATATSKENRTRSAGSFAEFATRMGATALPDLLEAAAAYTAFVEGAEEFSRPQLLRRVRAVSSNDFKREDGLRSFADLLAKGRFTKVRNGQFQVAGDSRFNPARRAG